MDVERCDLGRPDNTFVVVVLLDPGGGHTGDADAVTAHDDRLRLALGIQEPAVHRCGILRAEFEDMADFNSPGRLQGAGTAGTTFTSPGELEGSVLGFWEITSKVNVDIMIIGLVGAAFEVDPITHRH